MAQLNRRCSLPAIAVKPRVDTSRPHPRDTPLGLRHPLVEGPVQAGPSQSQSIVQEDLGEGPSRTPTDDWPVPRCMGIIQGRRSSEAQAGTSQTSQNSQGNERMKRTGG